MVVSIAAWIGREDRGWLIALEGGRGMPRGKKKKVINDGLITAIAAKDWRRRRVLPMKRRLRS